MQATVESKLDFLLRFREPDLERDFWQKYELDLRTSIRTAVSISLCTWSLGLGLTWVVLPEHFVHFAIIILCVIYIPFVLVILSTKGELLLGKYHVISGVYNLIFAILLIYFCSFFPHGTDMLLMLLIFTVFVGFYSYRLLLRLGMVVSGLYLLGFQLYITFFKDVEPDHYSILSFLVWLTWFFAFFAGYASEKSARLIFLQQRTIVRQKEQIELEKQAADRLLRNILPEEVALELQTSGVCKPRRFEEVTILFSDFKDFTSQVESMQTEVLIDELNALFSGFDDIMLEEGIEKIETIGDAYLAAAGLPEPVPDHAMRCVRAARKMLLFVEEHNRRGEYKWQIRIGLHTGPVTTGVVGKSKVAYDVYGDTVNIANRIQTAGEAGRINISATTHDHVRSKVDCHYRGALYAKGKGNLPMYFVSLRDHSQYPDETPSEAQSVLTD